MPSQDTCFTPFKTSIQSYSLPERFTFPFYYQPHPLCLLAAKELQDFLSTQTQWNHNFGLDKSKTTAVGKMFGVLLVKNKNNEIGYLSAFSGKVSGTNELLGFVPPVYDVLVDNGFFIQGQLEINKITEKLKKLEKNPLIFEFEKTLRIEKQASELQINEHRQKMIAGRKDRKHQRIKAESDLDENDFLMLKNKLSQQSIYQKNQLRDFNLYWLERVKEVQDQLEPLTDEIEQLKKHRQDLSAKLQKRIFDQYQFLSQQGTSKSLIDLFQQTAYQTPPAGAGECAAPKLLQYAFKEKLQPLALAEFWWGKSPKSEIKKHLNFYPACQGKCQPILAHMLDGLEIDENQLLKNLAKEKTIDIIYEDEVMLVINKPAELLSVPGANIEDSVYYRIKQSYPKATGALIVHRLDMSTSGLLLIALTKEANKNLQKQFIKRTIKKRYIALLDGLLKIDKGVIELPLRGDLYDRPRQLVCYEHGKHAKTEWEVIEIRNNQTKVYFYPVTGRTHQLRVHAAHYKGLNTPIVGDDLYGEKSNRLHLHAESLEFNHPVSRALMRFQIDADF